MSDFLIQPRFKIGDTVWLLLPTAPYNPGYVVMSGKVEEVARMPKNATIFYRVRFEDDTISVPNEELCLESKDALKHCIEEQIIEGKTKMKRMREAFEEKTDD